MARNHRKLLVLGALTFLGAGLAPAAFDAAEASDRLIRRCSAEAEGDVSMTAKYEERRGRKKFTIEMEADPRSGLQSGQTVVFVVGGERVGQDRLEPVIGGDLVAELDLDTQAGPGDDEDPFPRNFPQVSRGTKVRVSSGGEVILGCALR